MQSPQGLTCPGIALGSVISYNVIKTGRITMNLGKYFENTSGFGVLATADAEGHVDAAVYSRPHIIDDATVAFIMADRLTHRNLTANPHAVYLFREASSGYTGKRLYLTKLREEQDSPAIEQLRRKEHGRGHDEQHIRFLVFFRVDKVLPLTGSEPATE